MSVIDVQLQFLKAQSKTSTNNGYTFSPLHHPYWFTPYYASAYQSMCMYIVLYKNKFLCRTPKNQLVTVAHVRLKPVSIRPFVALAILN